MSPTNESTDRTIDQKEQLRADMEILNADEDVEVKDKSGNLETEEGEEKGVKVEGEDKEEIEGDGEGKKEDGEEGKEEEKGREDKEERAGEHARPTLTEIKSKYPNFFKDFPEMRHMLFREQEYTTLFPTIDDAREAQEQSQDFEHFSNLIKSGRVEDFSEFLNGIKQVNNLTSFATNFLPGLYKTDKDTYFAVTTPIAESLLRNAYKAAQQSGDENLQNAALHIARWALGDVGFATGEKTTQVAEPEAKKDLKYEQEKEQFYTQRYNDSKQYVSATAYTRLSSEIKKGLDPNGVFNDFTTQLLVKEILNEIGGTLEADRVHMDTINSMWRHAHKAGFAGNWKDRILSTYMSRARAIMPAIRARIRQQAQIDQEERIGKKDERATKSLDRREIQGSQNTQMGKAGGRAPSAQEVDWRKTSDMDILNDKVTLKKK